MFAPIGDAWWVGFFLIIWIVLCTEELLNWGTRVLVSKVCEFVLSKSCFWSATTFEDLLEILSFLKTTDDTFLVFFLFHVREMSQMVAENGDNYNFLIHIDIYVSNLIICHQKVLKLKVSQIPFVVDLSTSQLPIFGLFLGLWYFLLIPNHVWYMA